MVTDAPGTGNMRQLASNKTIPVLGSGKGPSSRMLPQPDLFDISSSGP